VVCAIGDAADQVVAGRPGVIGAGGGDACGPALERWLADGGLATGEAFLRDAAALVVLESAPASRILGRVLGHGEGFASDGAAGTTATIRRGRADAGVAPAEVAVVALAGARAAGDAIQRALGGAAP